MKHKFLLISLLPLSLTFLSGCSLNSNNLLTYGTYINVDINSLEEIGTSDLYEKAFNENETFLLAAYQGNNSISCLCWQTFENVIADYTNKYHEKVYVYNAHEQNESIKDLNISFLKDDSAPYLYIFKGKKKIASFSYNSNNDKTIFSDVTCASMYNRVHKFVRKPVMHYVDEAYLDGNLKTVDEAMVLYIRNKCGDCKYVLPNVIIPYVNNHSLKKNFWLFDLQPYYEISNKETATEEEQAVYQNIKNKYKLSASSNDKFGYLNGVVPTAHYYKNGELKGAAVYFNDVVSVKEDGTVYISDSFYRQERLNYLTYLVDYHKTVVLKDRVITDEAMQTKSGNYYWAQEKAAALYTPIWLKFLDYYLK